MGRQRKGFSLFEMVLVSAIAVVLVALAYPSLSGLAGKDGLTGKDGLLAARDHLLEKVRQAQRRAQEESRPYRLAIVPGQGNYRIAPDTEEFWGQSGGDVGTSKALVVAGTLPTGSRFDDPSSSSESAKANDETSQNSDKIDVTSYKPLVTFLPDGTIRENGKVALTTIGAKRVILKFQAQTDVVTTHEE